MNKTLGWVGAVVALALCWGASAETWYVDGSVSGLGDGKTWETAFKTIQEGIDAALPDDEVIVAEGTYTENVHFHGKNIVLRSTAPTDPPVVQNTIIDGNQSAPVVTFSAAESEWCVLSGFTIRNGKAAFGGGIFSETLEERHAQATIENNVVAANSAEYGGGLAYCDGAIRNNVIEDNSAHFNGGGLFRCGGIVENNTVTGNFSTQGGGLSYCQGTIRNNTVTRNRVDAEGGGLSWCDGIIENNIIAGNSARSVGGGLWVANGQVRNNTITANSAQYGGGLMTSQGSITNCIIWGNFAPVSPELVGSSQPTYSCVGNWEGGGIGNISASPHFVDESKGDYHLKSWSPCIDAGDPASDFSNEPEPNGGRINIGAYGNTAEATPPSDNTDGDSLPDDWEMLVLGNLASRPDEDPDGDGRSNLQEYYDGTDPTWAGPWYVDGSVPTSGDGTSWNTAFKTIQEGIDAAWERETVIVAPGIYVENIHFKGKNVKLRSRNPFDPTVVASTIIDGEGQGCVVRFVGSETEQCLLSGFTLRNGSADEPPNERGGGVCGGHESYRTRATIENNVITGNFAWDGGGIVYCGGIIRNNTITANTTQDDGGGIHRCSGLIVGNRIVGNSAEDNGGGIAKSDATIQNNIICNNTAGAEGGGLRGCDGLILSNTLVGNTARYGEGLALCEGVIRDCIVWGGTRHSVQLFDCAMPVYSCIDRWRRGGEGNISADPYFVDAANGDYHLQSWSPCIDAGYPDSPFWNEPDPNGRRVDMGAYGNTRQAASRSADSDDDQLPDDWEMLVFGNLAQAGIEDADGDKLSNREEYRKGSNPMVALPRAQWFVKGSVVTSGDGTSTDTPFKTIQQGIDAASGGDTVIVSPGIYFENIRFNGKNIVVRSTDPGNPSIVASTVIDGGQQDSVVAFLGSEDETCELAGFTIRNGKGVNGGGICGGLEEEGTHAAIHNNYIVGNSAPGYWNARRQAWSEGFGGGMAFCNGVIADNTISNNSSRERGGGLYGCDGAIQNNTVLANETRWGGGLYDCDGIIENNLVADNFASGEGGGFQGCDGTVQNNSIVNNSTVGDGGGLEDCLGTIRNCILWWNTAGGANPQVSRSNTPSFSCIEGWEGGGEGNISWEPGFVDPFSGDYHLEDDSPCVDAGVNFYWFAWPQRDLDGNCRLAGSTVDMGCYEAGSSADSDGDLLADQAEMCLGPFCPNPNLPDSDGDGIRDGLEVLRGTDPMAATPPAIIEVQSGAWAIQKALCLAAPGDEIIVYPGTYEGHFQFCGIDAILRSTEPNNPGVVAGTILDGEGSGPVVSFVGSESAQCVLAGFTIQNGHADHGAGVRGGKGERRTLASVRNNVITGNLATGSGAGAAWCDGTIENNRISGNESAGSGGGLAHCHGIIRSNTITGNRASWEGGGLFECNGAIQGNTIAGSFGTGLHNCDATIAGNTITATSYGDGLFGCDGKVSNNVIVGSLGGSGLEDCDGMVLNNLIAGNWSSRGGGLYLCDGLVQNNTIAMNSAYYPGGGLYECLGTISNCILWGNRGAALHQVAYSSVPSYSCIQDWSGGGEGNTAANPLFVGTLSGAWTAEPAFDPETFQTTLTDAAAAWETGALVGMLVNPIAGQPLLFVVASNSETSLTIWGDATEVVHIGHTYTVYDYRLSGGSPCIDAGENEPWMWTATDLGGHGRILPAISSWIVDIGAYESLPAAFQAYIGGAVPGVQLVWTSQHGASYTVWSCVDLLSAEWVADANVPSEGELTTWTDPEATSAGKFYRIESR